MPCKQGMQHPAAPCAGGAAGRAPPAHGSPSRAFPGTCCVCMHVPASKTQNLPPTGWLLPKGQGAAARAGCCLPVLPGWLPTGLSILGNTAGGETQPFAGETSRLATAREPLMLAPCAQHLAAHICEDRQVLGDAGGNWAVPIKYCSSLCEQGHPACHLEGLGDGVRFWMG